MDKRELIKAASIDSGLIQNDVRRSLESVLKCMMTALENGESISLNNFGTFSVKEMKARNSRNPSTGESIVVPSKKVIKFKIAPAYKPV
jgi:DNA-binding protein HU-beta